ARRARQVEHGARRAEGDGDVGVVDEQGHARGVVGGADLGGRRRDERGVLDLALADPVDLDLERERGLDVAAVGDRPRGERLVTAAGALARAAPEAQPGGAVGVVAVEPAAAVAIERHLPGGPAAVAEVLAGGSVAAPTFDGRTLQAEIRDRVAAL